MTARLIGKTDIQFDDPKLRRLMQHINRMTDELQRLQAMLDEGREGQVLVKRSSRDFDAVWGEGSASGSGEANTGSNVGGGVGIFRDKTGETLNFRSLVAGDGIEIEQEDSAVRISAEQADAGDTEDFEPLVIAGAFA